MRMLCVFLGVAMSFISAGLLNAEEVAVPGGTLDVQYATPPGAELKGAAAKWIQDSARAVAKYHGTFTIRHAVLRITPVNGHEVSNGYTNGWNGAIVTISLGRKAAPSDL